VRRGASVAALVAVGNSAVIAAANAATTSNRHLVGIARA
jgi:hypothetical protein